MYSFCVFCEFMRVCLWAAMASFNNRFNRCQTHDSHKRNEEEKDAERNKSGEGVRDKKDKETRGTRKEDERSLECEKTGWITFHVLKQRRMFHSHF